MGLVIVVVLMFSALRGGKMNAPPPASAPTQDVVAVATTPRSETTSTATPTDVAKAVADTPKPSDEAEQKTAVVDVDKPKPGDASAPAAEKAAAISSADAPPTPFYTCIKEDTSAARAACLARECEKQEFALLDECTERPRGASMTKASESH